MPDNDVIGGPIDWWTLSPQARAVILAGLGDWVRDLVRTFQIPWTEIPWWWYRHEGFVHELLALKQAREAMAYAPTEPEDAPLTWLHQLTIARGRLRALRDTLGGDARQCPDPDVQGWAAETEQASEWGMELEAYAARQISEGGHRA